MKTKFFLLIQFYCCFEVLGQNEPPFIDNLRTEYLTAPIGLDTQEPRFTWRLNDTRYGAHQSSFTVSVYEEDINGSRIKIWDSGHINSQKPHLVYSGPELSSFTKYYWTVEVEDMNQQSLAPAESFFEMGIVDQNEWVGNWITDNESISYRPATLFRKELPIEKPIKKARLFIANAGLHHITINGDQITDEILNSAFTKYDKRILYNTYDVTPFLNSPDNVIGVELGNGWYNHQTETVVESHRAPWRNRPSMLINLVIFYEDGQQEIISTDNSWQMHEGPTTFNSIFLSENYDFTKTIEGWDKPGFDTQYWQSARIISSPTEKIEAQTMPPVRLTESFRATEFIKKSNRNYVYKFLLNIAGITRITGSASQNTTLRIVHSEQVINNNDAINNHFFHKILRQEPNEEFATDIVKLIPGPFSYQPKFNYKGFQYVEVFSDQDIELDIESITALRVNSDMPQIGSFESDYTLLNQIRSASNNSYLSNMVGYPTDCPTREKNGWTGDAHFIIQTGLFNYESILIYEKWMRDHQDAQNQAGKLPSIIPSSGWGYDGAPFDWTASMILIPWDVYLMKGDEKILRENYESMKRLLKYWEGQIMRFQVWGIGDWQFPAAESQNDFIASAYYFRCTSLMAKIAEILDENRDFRYYNNQSIMFRDRINQRYYNPTSNRYGNGTLTEISLAIMYNVVTEDQLSDVKSSLKQLLDENDNSPVVGVLGSKMILNAMVKLGFYNEAFDMIKKTSKPSWGHWVEAGLTSMAEDWNYSGTYHTASLNHAYFGEINAWFFKALGGINPSEDAVGFEQINLNPIFDAALGEIQASHNSPYGTITSATTPDGDNNFSYQITLPPGTDAVLNIPTGFSITDYDATEVPNDKIPLKNERGQILLESGKHTFTFGNGDSQEYPFLLFEEETQDFGSIINENGKLYFQQGEENALTGTMTITNSKGQILSTYSQDFSGDRSFILDIEEELPAFTTLYIRAAIQYENGQKRVISKSILKGEY